MTGKRRVTDLKECARVALPKPLETKHEALKEMRGTNQRVYNDYRNITRRERLKET
jgi:hypothetical protein